IEVKSKDHKTTVRKDGERWVIEDRGGYPALFDKVKATVVAVADLEVLEPKTTNKELYPRLGVEGIDVEPSSSVLVNLADGQSKPLAALLVGKPQRRRRRLPPRTRRRATSRPPNPPSPR
ncbi:MAG: hypothetical protein ACREXX_21755, partial [Gammaproteobacteria bacterium]